MEFNFSGRTTALVHKFADWREQELPKNTPKAIGGVKFFDVQWSDCPVEIEAIVKQMWQNSELGNDNYIIKTTPDDVDHHIEDEDDIVLMREWLISQGVGEDEQVIIHWWW